MLKQPGRLQRFSFPFDHAQIVHDGRLLEMERAFLAGGIESVLSEHLAGEDHMIMHHETSEVYSTQWHGAFPRG
jgi:hypothetical protein